MTRKRFAGALVLLLAGALGPGGRLPAWAAPTLSQFVQAGLQDLQARARVVSKSDRELSKCGKGYVDAYRLSDQQIWCKEPGRVRVQAKYGLFPVRRITNGDRQQLTVPAHRQTTDVGRSPGKADRISDLGLVTASWVEKVESRWLKSEARGGKTLHQFEFWFPRDPGLRHEVWVDAGTRTIVEHVYYARAEKGGGVQRRILYSDLQQINGVWVPTLVTLYNRDERVAATMRYERIQVNTGLQDDLFAF